MMTREDHCEWLGCRRDSAITVVVKGREVGLCDTHADRYIESTGAKRDKISDKLVGYEDDDRE
jgi:hypothetical protein